MRIFKKIVMILAVLLVIVVSFAVFGTKSDASALEQKFIVRLYSGGNVVATYEAIGSCHLDGNTFVFNISPVMEQRVVRICGTYSVEQIQ